MDTEVRLDSLPEDVEVSELQIESEILELAGKTLIKTPKIDAVIGTAYHEKKEKNKKVNLGGSYRRTLAAKYKKPKTRGQKRK